jgi:hypothetical protein
MHSGDIHEQVFAKPVADVFFAGAGTHAISTQNAPGVYPQITKP